MPRSLLVRTLTPLCSSTFWAALFGVLALIWLGSKADELRHGYRFTGQQGDYYNLLVDGFLQGHLHMAVDPHPDMLSDDPEVRARAPKLLDANFYNGRYYLYYGVVPAVLVMLPYSWLTGHDLDLTIVTLIFVITGFFFALSMFVTVRRHFGLSLPGWLTFSLVLLLAWGAALPTLVVRSMFYELPIAAGFACCMAAGWALLRATLWPEKALRYLAWASLALGLAVGCRPNYLFALPGLALAGFLLARPTAAGPRAWLRLAVALVVPAGVIGLLLATYNYARFDHPLEFGFNYGINDYFVAGDRLAHWSFMWPNAFWYLFAPPSFSPYFPFVFPVAGSFRPPQYFGDEQMHGQFLFPVLALVAFLASRPAPARATWTKLRPWWLALTWTGAGSFVFLVSLTIRGNRYSVDFLGPWLVVIVLWLAVGVSTRAGTKRFAGLSLAGTALAVGLVAHNAFAAMQQFEEFHNRRPRTFATLSQWSFPISHGLQKVGLIDFRPVRVQVSFAERSEASVEPLVTAGVPYYTDGVYLAIHPGNHIEVMVDRHGYGGPRSGLIPIELGQTYTFDVILGSFFPPAGHPYYKGAPLEEGQLTRAAKVLLDGRPVVQTTMSLNHAPPWTIEIGANTKTLKPYRTHFTEAIVAAERPSLSALLATGAGERALGMWRMRATWGEWHRTGGRPILASGTTGQGNLLFAETGPDDQIRLGIDFWGYGLVWSDWMPVPEIIEVFVGPQVAKHDWPDDWEIPTEEIEAQRGVLRVWGDGRPIWTVPLPYHPDSYDHVQVGANWSGFSTAFADFFGRLENEILTEPEVRTFLRLNLQQPVPNRP